MILWGPPGSGKTSLAKLMASYVQAEFVPLSAVLIGVPALRLEIKKAELARETLKQFPDARRIERINQLAGVPLR